ncbi:tyrosine-type recombinase/integrase [Modicisalibacter tunisiensis]|uniref:phage integrase n=1 Tax=Modicisalibacter tunisiensis TaxID=390637 RepID=UPI001CC9AFF2|nr:tyrosine-type recombinase/integrase [Modicisalibacter tunisiensis]MBZ9538929.1 tyrosine-type recombinase/integrase [Modicisalibacter tunisiensis]
MSIRKTKTGWCVDIWPHGRDGKRVRKTLRTKAEAKRFEAYVFGKAASGEPYQPKKRDNRRLRELITLWYEFHGVSLKDGKRRLSQLNALADMMGNPIARTITAMDAARFRQKRLADGISPSTANHDQAHLRAVFNKLIRLGEWDQGNPFASIQPLRLDESELAYLTEDQIDRLLTILEHRPNQDAALITRLCLATGARWSEAQYLRAENLRDGRVTFVATKNGRNRTIPLPQGLYRTLVEHAPKIGRVFPTTGYNPFSDAIKEAGIRLPRGQRTHVLRHTFASHFMMNGGDVLTLQKILGHQTIQMTMRYAHLSPDHLADAIKFAPKVRRQNVDTSEKEEEPSQGRNR